MKTEIKLNKKHELILQTLYAAKGFSNFSIEELENTITAIDTPNFYSCIHTLRIIAGKEYAPKYHPFGSRELSDFEKEIRGLEFIGLVSVEEKIVYETSLITLTEDGRQIAQRLKDARRVIVRPRPSQRESVFIASAFGYDDTDSLYVDCFVPACESLKYKPNRVDLSEPSETITATIMDGITETACIIADLTYARPSVYFEVGYAHGLGIPLLLTCRKDHFHGKQDNARVHFDLEQFKISFWTRNAKGKFDWSKTMSPTERMLKILKPYKKTRD
jgi:nucleoside 2-deoxyribosyltransferase